MPRTAIIHIGVPKSGSTRIQSALFGAGDVLAERGFHYPDLAENHSEPLALAFWSLDDAVRLARFPSIDDRIAAVARRAELRDQLAEIFERAAPNDVILSAEELSNFRPAEFADLMAFIRQRTDRVRVIAYVRDPFSWMTSAAQQATKWSGETLDQIFASPRIPDYAGRFSGVIAATQGDEFEMRVFATWRPGFDVLQDFAEAIGLDLSGLPERGRSNAAVSQTTAMTLSAINAISPPFIEGRHSPVRAFGIVDLARQPGPRFRLPRETLDLAREAIARDRAWVADALGHDPFPKTDPASVSIEDWFGPDRAEHEDFARRLLTAANAAQNEKALSSYVVARRVRADAPERANALLTQAGQLAIDREKLHLIATEAAEHQHPQRLIMFAKQRLMTRILDPKPDDPPLDIGNPFDRRPPRVGPRGPGAPA